jgi:hypothetical protein
MFSLNKLGIRFVHQQPGDVQAPTTGIDHEDKVTTESRAMGKDNGTVSFDPDSVEKGPDMPPDPDAQRGIQKIEAVTSAWSTWSLAALLFK